MKFLVMIAFALEFASGGSEHSQLYMDAYNYDGDPDVAVYEWCWVSWNNTVCTQTASNALSNSMPPRGEFYWMYHRVKYNDNSWSGWAPPQGPIFWGPLPGDATQDCAVGGPDYSAVGANWGATCP